MKRFFIGIKSSPEFIRLALAWQNGHKELPLRFVRSENIHLTLVPPWRASRVEEVIARIKDAARGIGPFTLLFEIVSAGPRASKPMLVWITAKQNEALTSLKNRLDTALGNQGSAWTPHVTLGRIKHQTSAEAVVGLLEKVSWREAVAAVTLFETLSDGSPYRVLGTVPLAKTL